MLGPSPGKGVPGVSRPEACARVRRALPHHVRHVDPGAAALPTRARRSRRLHRRRGARQADLPRGTPGAAAHRREHRHCGRDLPDRQAPERRARARLRGRAAVRIRIHPRRHRRRPRDRHAAAGDRGRGRGNGCVHPRGDQGLDVPPRAGLGRRMGERTDPRLPDVPLGARAAEGGVARSRRRAADHPGGGGDSRRLLRGSCSGGADPGMVRPCHAATARRR
jgi:hypothetical protein